MESLFNFKTLKFILQLYVFFFFFFFFLFWFSRRLKLVHCSHWSGGLLLQCDGPVPEWCLQVPCGLRQQGREGSVQ